MSRVELKQDGICLTISLTSLIPSKERNGDIIITRNIPIKLKRRGVEMRLVIDGRGPARVDPTLIKTIARAHVWLQEILAGQTLSEIATRDSIDRSIVGRTVNLAFLSPDIIESIMSGYQPPNLNTERLIKRSDLPLDWQEQRQILNLS